MLLEAQSKANDRPKGVESILGVRGGSGGVKAGGLFCVLCLESTASSFLVPCGGVFKALGWLQECSARKLNRTCLKFEPGYGLRLLSSSCDVLLLERPRLLVA